MKTGAINHGYLLETKELERFSHVVCRCFPRRGSSLALQLFSKPSDALGVRMIRPASDEWTLEDLVPGEDELDTPPFWKDLMVASGLAMAFWAIAAFMLLS
jgi:hypothetical protein